MCIFVISHEIERDDIFQMSIQTGNLWNKYLYGQINLLFLLEDRQNSHCRAYKYTLS